MIYALTPMEAVRAIMANIGRIEVNALLQVGIKVLEEGPKRHYLIQMGSQTFQSKSDQPLKPGVEYWGEITHTKEGIIHLKNLHPKPSLLRQETFFDFEMVEDLAKKSHPVRHFKEHILHLMAQSQSKEHFQNLTSLLLSMHQQILSLPLKYEGRSLLLQMKSRSEKGKEQRSKSVEFYAALNNLGPLEGVVTVQNHLKEVVLRLFYKKSVQWLKGELLRLKGFERVEVLHSSHPVLPLWDAEGSALLDIKG